MTRNRASAKKAGSSFERLVADYLSSRLENDAIDRQVKTGRADKGDIRGVKTIRGTAVVIECKNTSRDNLPLWIREAQIEAGNADTPIGVVCHKRWGSGKAEDQYVSMDLATFALLLEGGPDDRPVIVIDTMTRGAA